MVIDGHANDKDDDDSNETDIVLMTMMMGTMTV